MFIVRSVDKRPNLRHLCERLGGTVGLLEKVGFKKTTESMSKHKCPRGVSSKLRAQQRRNHGKRMLCGHEERTTDWYWKSVENVKQIVDDGCSNEC